MVLTMGHKNNSVTITVSTVYISRRRIFNLPGIILIRYNKLALKSYTKCLGDPKNIMWEAAPLRLCEKLPCVMPFRH
jgi:hypothetical protein